MTKEVFPFLASLLITGKESGFVHFIEKEKKFQSYNKGQSLDLNLDLSTIKIWT